jgi:hypothetical protein
MVAASVTICSPWLTTTCPEVVLVTCVGWRALARILGVFLRTMETVIGCEVAVAAEVVTMIFPVINNR